jgi:hypothetical protein
MTGWHKVLGLAAITSFGLAVIDSNALAQQKPLKEQLVGAWMVVRCEVVQPDGKGATGIRQQSARSVRIYR